MDFDVEILPIPDQNSTSIKITTNNGKTISTIIKNRDYQDDTKALISRTILNLLCDTLKEMVKAKMEEKGIEVLNKRGRPKSMNSKRVISEEQKERLRKNSLKWYYKHKTIAVN